MEFKITNSTKRNARKTRIKNEKKWLPFRISALVFAIISLAAFVIGTFVIDYENGALAGIYGVVFAAALIICVIMEAVIINMSSHWIMDRLNERIWIEGDVLYHFVQTSFAAGLNSRNADERGYLFAMDISSIAEACFDPKSKRIEFKAWGNGCHYSDVRNEIIDKQWALKGFPAVFYDYTEPSLIEALKAKGVTFREETLNFKIRDNQI